MRPKQRPKRPANFVSPTPPGPEMTRCPCRGALIGTEGHDCQNGWISAPPEGAGNKNGRMDAINRQPPE